MVRATMKIKFRQVIPWMFVMFCLVACGGGGGASIPPSPPPAGGTPPPGNSPAPAPATTVPQFTRAFAQFLGTPSATAAADLDGNSRDDLVAVTTDFFASGPGSDRLYVYYQQNGALGVPKFVDTAGGYGNFTWSVALCDIDGDGQKEILVGYWVGDLTVYKLAADGTPYLSSTLTGVRSTKIICVDIDGDGLSDVVTYGKPGVNMQVLLQKNGVLTEDVTYPSNVIAVAGSSFGNYRPLLEPGDINGDGKTDIVFFGRAAGAATVTLNAYIQIAPGRFDPNPITMDFPRDSNNSPVGGFAVVDLRSNNTRNIVASYGGNAPSPKILIASYGVNGQTLSSTSFPTLDIPTAIRVGDINADGRKDIVVFHDGWGFGVHYQNADGSFTMEQLLPTYIADQAMSGQVIAFGDFNSDGKRDIAVADQTALFVFFRQ